MLCAILHKLSLGILKGINKHCLMHNSHAESIIINFCKFAINQKVSIKSATFLRVQNFLTSLTGMVIGMVMHLKFMCISLFKED